MCGIFCLIKYKHPINNEEIIKYSNMLSHRGPDAENYKIIKPNYDMEIFMGFRRLAIMDTSNNALQPFEKKGKYVMCNGEIYGYKTLIKKYRLKLQTKCDCEVILPLYEKMNIWDMIIEELDAEFAMILYDKIQNIIYAVRDRYGIRPLFYGYNSKDNTIAFASEIKALHPIMEYIEPVKPNKMYVLNLNIPLKEIKKMVYNVEYYNYGNIHIDNVLYFNNIEYIEQKLRYLLIKAVSKRLHADRPIGFLLSGGLDSSLIVAIATRIIGSENIVCFSVGLDGSADVEAAKKVVKYLGITQHHIIHFSIDDGINIIPEVIKCIESYDITTIRASTPQLIMAKYINKQTNIKVILSGEGSDEIHGSYRYFRNAPNAIEFRKECLRLLEELYLYDNLRTDRTMASQGLEVRIPFLDYEYVEFIKKIDPSLLMYKVDNMEKKILRDSFKGFLPEEILYRSKEAFSDAVSSKDINWYKSIVSLANTTITDDELINNPFEINKPQTKEALYYRRIFSDFYPNRDNIIPHYWLPKWSGEIIDPSATILNCY